MENYNKLFCIIAEFVEFYKKDGISLCDITQFHFRYKQLKHYVIL